ncbi:hypothetical protein PHYBLDRAFT_165820 [Phycomyces blakesleeanus NRRL 1555(-)]|uniref:Uncharacterized protein n=1 Tax=Phycomyces blakesleeanus (strain ATCC 8743b / DSM 1359 / FGSC 10004 / NBRC 33097 / NRRL 1555) TaxID=763407 RepID=A0A167NGE7_PHYB8|nr:hypothetical protein PHYBLDRAFT_165820 [Phycomyces blakesleeanus NRRL 1555(-)]OAD75840.1 hypothetical protein PHYBLDRAFT_165820 [Phycomyces blakesleeanus NRRL 1555(-)]|eukprot:XP_018293880.1 hypothetical protein PHYBLDRAFT_165820 [Phycomyces blakesleeanus NRRL 1555(-)]
MILLIDTFSIKIKPRLKRMMLAYYPAQTQRHITCYKSWGLSVLIYSVSQSVSQCVYYYNNNYIYFLYHQLLPIADCLLPTAIAISIIDSAHRSWNIRRHSVSFGLAND